MFGVQCIADVVVSDCRTFVLFLYMQSSGSLIVTQCIHN